jgi:LPXTG-site transpeptidase (sortase) family protein
LASITSTFLPAACSSVTSNTSAGNNIDLVFAALPTGCQVTVTYEATLLSSVVPGEALINTANVTYTSLPGVNGTAGNPTGSNTPGSPASDTGERDGSGTPAHNDYFDSDGAQVDVTRNQPVKSIVATSAAHTTEAGDGSAGNERALVIGEEITYAILLAFGEGTTPSDRLVDDLPAGLEVLAGTPEVITTAAASGGLLTADFNGTIGTQNITIVPGDGGSVTFDFTNVVVTGDNDITNNTILVRFGARLTNTAVNTAGAVISNEAANQVGAGAPVNSNSVGAIVVEPLLDIAKNADDSSWTYGQVVTFTLNVSHDVSSTAEAFDITVTDVIPAGLTYSGGISAPAGWVVDASAAPTLTWTCATANGCSLPLAGSATLTYQATVNSPPGPPAFLQGDDTATNTATVVWTSLPGSAAGERDGSGGVNDYADGDSHIGGLENYYSIGNRVWFDTDNDSLIDVGEVGADGVVVNLYAASDITTILATDTTAGGGYYLFDFLPAGEYVVTLAASNFASGAVLDGYWSSGTTVSGGVVVAEAPAPDADVLPADSDDNGVLESGGPLAGAIVSLPVSLGPGAAEPTGETDLDGGSQGAQPDNRANMTVDFGLIFVPRVNLSVTKDDGVSYYLPGGALAYTVVVTNNGPNDANGVTVQDARPAQISSWTWTCAAGTPPAYNCSGGSSDPFTDSLDLPQGASVTYEVAAQVDSSAAGDLTNNVSVAPPDGMLETDSSDNDDTDVDGQASLRVTKDDGVSIVSPSASLTYTILLENNGAVDLTNITVTDTLPADVAFQSASPAPTANAGGVLTWTGISLAAGADMTITVTVRVTDTPAGTSITNNVTVTDADTGASDSDDDTDTVSQNSNFTKTLVLSSAAHTADPRVAIGEILTYELTLTVPPGAMDNVLMVDAPQTGLAFVDLISVLVSNPDTDGSGAGDTGVASSVMLLDGTGLCTNCDDGTTAGTSNPLIENSGGKITFDFGAITNSSVQDETITIRYELIVLDAASNQDGVNLTNSAVWTWDGGVLQTSAPLVEVVEPDLAIDKTAQPAVAPLGATINFEIDIAHTPQSSTDAFDVVVTDVLPAGLVYIPGSEVFTGLAPTSFNYDSPTATLTIAWDVFPLGQTANIAFDTAFVGPSPTTNVAAVEWTSLPIDPTPGGPVQLSAYNSRSTERWYDPADFTGLNNYAVQDSFTIAVPGRLPSTGFAPNEITSLPNMPEGFDYSQTGLWLEIPRLNVKMEIVGVPFGDEDWNITWLNNNAGWLEGSAYPTHAGNSALTAHAYLSNGLPGPFVNLGKLRYGDKVIVHLAGQKYIFEVRENISVRPTTVSVLKHEEYPWLTLITCKTYDEKAGGYVSRIVVRAVLITIESE